MELPPHQSLEHGDTAINPRVRTTEALQFLGHRFACLTDSVRLLHNLLHLPEHTLVVVGIVLELGALEIELTEVECAFPSAPDFASQYLSRRIHGLITRMMMMMQLMRMLME